MKKYVVNLYSTESNARIGNPAQKVEFTSRAVAYNFGKNKIATCPSYKYFDIEEK